MNTIQNINLNGILSKLKDHAEQFRGTEMEKKVKDATSNANWGVTLQVKEDIARATYDHSSYNQVMGIIWKRMSESGKNWKMVFKSLDLLEYLLKRGSERVISEAEGRQYQIRTLKDFHFSDSDGRDKGGGIREKSRAICELLNDKSTLDAERARARSQVGKYSGMSNFDSFSTTSFGHRTSIQYDPEIGGRDATKKKKKTKKEMKSDELSDDVLSSSDDEKRRPTIEYGIADQADSTTVKKKKKKKKKKRSSKEPQAKDVPSPSVVVPDFPDLLATDSQQHRPDSDPFAFFDFQSSAATTQQQQTVVNQQPSLLDQAPSLMNQQPSLMNQQPSYQQPPLLNQPASLINQQASVMNQQAQHPSFDVSFAPATPIRTTVDVSADPFASLQQSMFSSPTSPFFSPTAAPPLSSQQQLPSPSLSGTSAMSAAQSSNEEWGFVAAPRPSNQQPLDLFKTGGSEQGQDQASSLWGETIPGLAGLSLTRPEPRLEQDPSQRGQPTRREDYTSFF